MSITKRIRASDGDFTTLDNFYTWLYSGDPDTLRNSGGGLTQNIDVLLQGDMEHSSTTAGLKIGTFQSRWAGFKMTFKTDPSEQLTPATINLGENAIQTTDGDTAVSSGTLEVTKLKLKTTRAYIVGGNENKVAGQTVSVHDCIIYTQGLNVFGGGNLNGQTQELFHCHIFQKPTSVFGLALLSISNGTTRFVNNFFGGYRSDYYIVLSSDSNTLCDSNTFWNYAYVPGFNGVLGTNAIIDQDPNLVDVMIQSNDDSIATIAGRNSYPTLSSQCLTDIGNLTYKTASDILGYVRGESGSESDRGAYELASTYNKKVERGEWRGVRNKRFKPGLIPNTIEEKQKSQEDLSILAKHKRVNKLNKSLLGIK